MVGVIKDKLKEHLFHIELLNFSTKKNIVLNSKKKTNFKIDYKYSTSRLVCLSKNGCCKFRKLNYLPIFIDDPGIYVSFENGQHNVVSPGVLFT